MRLSFCGRQKPEVGVIIELQLVDQDSLTPVAAAPHLLPLLEDDPAFQPGLYQSLIQVHTPILPTVGEVERVLREKVSRLRAVAAEHGVTLLSSGTHPVVGWQRLHITESPKYDAFIRRLQWVGRRAAVFGMHIHVGVPDGEKAIALNSALAAMLPLPVALAGSSPFWRGIDTGLASCRARVIENIPNAGLPPNLVNFGEFQAYIQTLRTAETIERVTDIWWDVRPNVSMGTIELQACDMPHTLKEVLALTAFVQVLVVWLLALYEEGEPLPSTRTWLTRENKWRAVRFGVDAELVADGTGRLRGLKALFAELRGHLAPVITRLGHEAHFELLESLLEIGPGYVRQRREAQARGLPAVCRLLRDELLLDRITDERGVPVATPAHQDALFPPFDPGD